MKTALTALLALSAAATLSTAAAQPQLSAQSIIVNPVQTALDVRVWTDRAAGSTAPSYRIGEPIRISASVNQDAYIYLFNVDVDGTVDLILPNTYSGGANFVKANTTVQFPAPQAGFTFTVDGPVGLNKVLALASLTPLNLGEIATFKAQNSLATVSVRGEQGLAQALSIVVTPVPQNSWTSSTALYTVANRVSVLTPRPVPPVRPVQPIRPVPPVRPVELTQPVPTTPQTPLLDLIGALFGGLLNVNTVSPVQATFDQQLQSLQAEGYRVLGTRAVAGGSEATLQSATGTARLLVTQGQGRTVDVSVTKSSRYRY